MTLLTSIEFGKLPAICLKAPDGAQATMTLFGAQVVSWIPANGTEQLFCSAKSVLDGSSAIRGGVPVIFPQFNQRGEGVRHGFARLNPWRLTKSGVESGIASAEFYLNSAGEYSAQWPHDFSLLLKVSIHADQLTLALRVRNKGSHAFSFCAALHSYFHIEDLPSATVDGLVNTAYTELGIAQIQTERLLPCTGPVDRLYHQVRGDLVLATSHTRLMWQQTGFRDAVVWNPGKDTRQIVDLGEGESDHFVCVESAQLDAVQLEPGKEWLGTQRVQCA